MVYSVGGIIVGMRANALSQLSHATPTHLHTYLSMHCTVAKSNGALCGDGLVFLLWRALAVRRRI